MISAFIPLRETRDFVCRQSDTAKPAIWGLCSQGSHNRTSGHGASAWPFPNLLDAPSTARKSLPHTSWIYLYGAFS